MPSIHWVIEPNFVKIVNGKNSEDVYLIPNFIAGQNIKLWVTVPWINEITWNVIDILPDVPITIWLTTVKPKLEAKLWEKTNIKATLSDRYWNITFNDSSHNIKFEIPNEYKKYVNFKDNTYTISLNLNKWVSETDIFTSEIPWSIFIKWEVSPNLWTNSFTHTDDSWKSITVSWISENVLNIETYYLFNKEKLNNINYNSLYTVLLWSNYWDITKSWYLWWEILFNPWSRSLAISSILNNIYAKDIAFGITPWWKILSWNKKDDASFDLNHEIISNENWIQINFFDNIYKDLISKLWFNFDPQNTNLISCDTDEETNISNCNILPNKTNIILKWFKTDNSSYKTILKNDSLVLQFNSYDIFSINSSWQIIKDPSINLKLDEDTNWNFAWIHIFSNKQLIGYLWIKFDSELIWVYNSSFFPSILSHKKNQILLESSSNSYSYDYNYLWNSSFGSKWIYFFKTNSEALFVDKDMVFSNSKIWIENYIEEAWIWWEWQNKILLEFAWWNIVWDATKFHQTYSMINLWDPIVSLKTKANSSFDFDKTIWKKIAEWKQDILETYKKINFNWDSFDDIVMFYDSWKIELLANYEWNFKNMWYLAYVSDAWKERKWVWDFNWDSFDDIVMVDQKWKLILLQNNDWKFIRFDIHDKVWLVWKIQQLEVFDMDRDWKDDIITVDDSSELNILYWAWQKNIIYFERKLVDNTLWLKINEKSIDSWWAIFFDWLEQLGQPSELQKKYYEESLKLFETADKEEEKDIWSENYEKMINNLIYYQYQYSTQKESYSQEEKKTVILNSVGTDDNWSPDSTLSSKIYDLQNEIVDLNATWMTDVSNFDTTNIEWFKTFLRSEYAYNKWIKIEKKYIWKSGNSLKSWDKVKITLDITNTTNNKMDNVIYLDSNKNIFSKEDITYFEFTQNNKTTKKQLQELTDWDFEYIFEDFSLNPWEKINISYELTVPLVAFGKITVGLLDSSDPYWEIALNPNNECNATQIIWKNTNINKRWYSRFTKDFKDNSQIPAELRKNTIDNNVSWDPDYLDLLSWDGDLNSLSSDKYNSTTNWVLLFKTLPWWNIHVKVARLNGTEDIDSTTIKPSIIIWEENPARTKLTFWKSISTDSLPICNEKIWTPSFVYIEQSLTWLWYMTWVIDNWWSRCLFNNNDSYSVLTKYTYSNLVLKWYNIDQNTNLMPDREDIPWSKLFSFDPSSWNALGSWLNNINIWAIESQMDDIIKWLGCWFGWWSCIAMPLNWAPLAPGSSPTIFGFPLTPNLMQPSAWLPAFSMLTWSIWPYCFPIPSVWPWSPLSMPPCSGILWAWWMLWATSVTNQFRIYVTPTITWAVWVALCFGWPSMSMWMIPPQAVSPLVPWWNCIVAAKPLIWCSDDWSDWNPSSIWAIPYSNFAWGWWNSFINANSCNKNVTKPSLTSETKRNIEYYIKWDKSVAKNILKDTATQHWWLNSSSWPLLNIWWQESWEWLWSLDIGIDTSALANFDFGNILKINFKRVMSFPDFIMDWVTRQIEEIVTKLTALPTLYIILPDLSWILNSDWNWFTKNLKDAFDSWNKNSKLADNLKSKANIKQDPVDSKGDKVDKAITNISNQAKSSVSSTKDSYNNFIEGNRNKITSVWNTVSWIKAAYQFLSNLPLIQFENETVDVNIPWISFEDLDKWIVTAKMTAKQWKNEIERAKNEWSKLWDPWKLANEKISINAEEALASIENAINSLEEFKKFPEKFLKFLTWKEKYMSEIICNVEIISEMLGWWIYDNGKRFKSWVELIILIKAILKSWQLFIDIFADYKASCDPCKNERMDLLHFIFKLISAVIPQIPIIQFPKWPDIFFDLHNIRAWIKILMPDFKLNVIPIVLPNLPQLHLPDIPNVNITLPSIPTLPKLPDLPDLPDMPSLPSVKLPDLPPPPTIPKLFWFVQVFLNILKLIFKVLCILRKNPFVPEWRSWDQIAFITERNGTLPLDFLSINFPQLSYPFVDAIKVTTFVNLELEVEFILELAKSIVEPFNRFSNNIANMWKLISFPNIDLSEIIPQEINIDASNKWEWVKINTDSTQWFNLKNNINLFGYVIIRDILKLVSYINENKSNEVNINDFKKILSSNIQNLALSKDPKEKLVFYELDKAIKYNWSKEDRFIQELINNNKNKFKIIKNYINLEKQNTKLQILELQNIIKEDKSIQNFSLLWKFKNQNIQINSVYDNNNETKKILLNELEKENNKILKSFDDNNNYESEIKTLKTDLITNIKSGLSSFSKDLNANNSFKEMAYFNNKLLANNILSTNSSTQTQTNNNSDSSMYSYNYEWIYMRNNVWNTTRLFNYIDEVDKKDIVIEIDFDKDWDIDVIYKMWDALYLKENLKNKPNISSSSNAIKQYDISDINKKLWVTNSITDSAWAPNYLQESFIPSSNFINFSFSPANLKQDNKFRFEYYDYINRFDKISAWEIPKSITPETNINYIDLISDLSLETITEISTWFVLRKNVATFDAWIWEWFIKQNDFKILKKWDNSILIQPWKFIYAGQDWASIKFKTTKQNDFTILNLPSNYNLEFNESTEIIVLRWKIYLFYNYITKWMIDLNSIKWIPVLPWTYVETFNKNTYFKIKYFDESEFKSDSLATYEYYSLWQKNENYNVSLNRQNNLYYWKLYSFWNNKKWTITALSLLSPQSQADKEAPLISLAKSIKIPVYQKYSINLQQYISDISQIKKIYIDWDLSFDSDWDWILDNDKDSLNNSNIYNIKKWETIYDLKFWPFNDIFKKKIKLFAVDENDNIWEFLLDLEVYAPIPQIRSITWSTIWWIINEKLINEPVDIFRLRNWLLERIVWLNENSWITNKEWKFNYNLDFKKWIEIKNNSWAIIWKIDENTWKIYELNNKFIVNIVPASEKNKTKIEILEHDSKNVIFYQNLNLISNNIIEKIDNFNNIFTNWIYIKINKQWFMFTKNAFSSPVLPNWWFITDDLYKAIIWISIDWNVYILNNDYVLEYDTFKDYIIYKIKNTSWTIIWEILFKINAEYIL